MWERKNMRETRIGSITTDDFKPRTKDRSFATNFHLGRLTIGFFGEDVVDLCRKISVTGDFSSQETERINKYFLGSSRQIYKLPNWTHPQSFYRERRKDSILAINYFGSELVPELSEAFELREEIANLSDRPSDLLRYLAMPEKIDPTLAYEAQRHAIIHHQLGTIEARTLKLCNLLSDIQNLLNEELFEASEGSAEDFCSESFHDVDTNEVVGFPDRGDPRPLTAHLKRRWISVRKIPKFGLVHEKSREKKLGPTLVKSWGKALKNGGIVHIDDAVQDSIAMRFVLMDDAVSPEELADLVVSVIKSGVESRIESNHPRKIPKIIRVENDPKTGTDHGQSTEINFNARRKIWFESVPTPLEITFYSRETYLNSELEVGVRDAQTGLYQGRGHKLFELRRGIDVIRVPFSQEIYKKIDDDRLYTAFISQSNQVAYGLRNRYRA